MDFSKKKPPTKRGLVVAAISLCFGASVAYAQQVTFEGPGLACKSYDTFEKIYAFVKAKQSAHGDRLIADRILNGKCTTLKSAVLINRGIYYSRVTDADGREWYVIAQSVQD